MANPRFRKSFCYPRWSTTTTTLRWSGLYFDLRRPVGSRVVRLAKLDGSPLGGGTFRLCTSNYRATGTGGYDVLRKCPVLWRGGVEMPDLTARYIQTHSPVPQLHNAEMRVIW